MLAKPSIISLMTHKSGPFLFSCSYDEQKILPLLIEGNILYRSIADLPILPHITAQLKTDLLVRSIYGTAAIEGNTLNEQEVQNLLTSAPATSDLRAEKEISNLKALYALLEEPYENDVFFQPQEELLKSIHAQLTQGIDYYHNTPGAYRNEVVKVGDANHGGEYTPPKTYDDVRNLMRIFMSWINDESMKNLDPLVRAALSHYYVAMIHPFQDGNGRTARFLEALMIKRADIQYLPEMMSNYYYKNIDDYFIAFSQSQSQDREDVTQFITFFFRGVIESLTEIKKHVVFSIRELTLKDYYAYLLQKKELTQRQFNLLMILLKTLQEFTLSDLFSDPVLHTLYRTVSEHTARRDIKKLSNKGYIYKDEENKKYMLNMYLLG